MHRRQVPRLVAGTGLGTPDFHRALVGLLQEDESDDTIKVTSDMVKTAEWISDTDITEE